MNKNIEKIHEFYKESSKILLEKIDIVYGMILKKIDELIQLGSGENISSSQFEKLFKEFETFYKDEIKILEIFIKDQFFSLQYKLNNKINDSLASFAIHEFENSSWYSRIRNSLKEKKSGAIIFGKFIFFPNVFITSLIISIISSFFSSCKKEKLIEKLKSLRKEIENSWDSTYFKSQKLLIKTINDSQKNLMLIYETQMSKFDEENVQNLYHQFIQIIGDKYKGKYKDGKKNGYGIYVWFDGSKFEGNFENDSREGYGKILSVDGTKFEGFWLKNEKEGFGKLLTKENNIYEGEFKKGKKDGYGIFTLNDGKKYIGEFKNDDIEGIGIITYENGNRYEGEFCHLINGIGTLFYLDGRKFEGTWKDGKKNGRGIFYSKEGNKYEGYWENDRRVLDNYIENKEYVKKIIFLEHTKVKIEYVDGDKYEGDYNPSTKTIEGLGTYFFNHDEIYKGGFKNNVFSGKGELFYDGNKISGNFKNGKLNDYGEIEMKNGNTLKGDFKDGKKEGVFSYYDKSLNKTVKHIYENDIFVEELDE